MRPNNHFSTAAHFHKLYKLLEPLQKNSHLLGISATANVEEGVRVCLWFHLTLYVTGCKIYLLCLPVPHHHFAGVFAP